MVSLKYSSFSEFPETSKFTETNMLATGIVIAVISMVVIVVLSACFIARRRSGYRYTNLAITNKCNGRSRPNQVKPVSSLKNAAGPGGLKKSPSPIPSPEGATLEAGNGRNFQSNKQQQEAAAFMAYNALHEVNQQKCPMIDWREDEGVEEDFEDTCVIDGICVPTPCGTLRYRVNYNFERNSLTVHIVWAMGLVTNFGNNGHDKDMLDPYIKLQLLPEKQHKIKTRVVRNTHDPVYDEEFVFYGINYNQLQSTTLHFAVIAFDRFLRDKIVGEALCSLCSMNLKDSQQTIDISTTLVNRCFKFQNAKSRGELLISLCLQPAMNKLCVIILKAKDLPAFDITGYADPYVKIYLLNNGKRIAKKKTQIKKRTLAPVYNQIFVFEYPETDDGSKNDFKIEVRVIDWDRITKNEIMGRLEIGPKVSSEHARTHWELAFSNPWKQIAYWHQLTA